MRTFVRILKSALHARRLALLIGFCLAMAAPQANAREHFGKVQFPVACNPGVQDEFELALAMLHTFSFPAAAKTFMAIAQKDPDCAMAYWGIAATAIGSLYGGRPGPMALQGGQAVEKAKAIGGKSARERDYVATVEVFYKGAETLDYAARVRAYADALEQLHRKYPEDREAEIFYAYALSALGAPTDQTFTYQLRGAAILEKLYAELPDHPGVIHYLLHAYDNTPYASRGLTAALRLAKVAPSSPHALQFPAHIFNRMGLWRESIETNQAGAAVDDLFFKPHAMDFLVHSYLQTGQAGLGENGFREVTNSKRAIRRPKDVYSLKIRVPPNPLLVEIFQALGAKPVTMNWDQAHRDWKYRHHRGYAWDRGCGCRDVTIRRDDGSVTHIRRCD
jgi:hypothetical protein